MLCELALPYDDDMPTAVAELVYVFTVAFSVSFQFFLPVVLIRFWLNKVVTSYVAMPETAVNEDNGVVFWQNYIRLAGIAFIVLSITKAL
jgi:hypothetical protein